jgi:hypothetical protein
MDLALKNFPFGNNVDYIKYTQTANNMEIEKLIKILAMLSQKKFISF